MTRVADIIAADLVAHGLKQVFMITGGGAMHLNDAFGRNKGLRIFFNHHEQASAMAAESYARLSGEPAVLNVTTGPGGINALNGVYGAYVDSIPMIVVSGQIKRDTMLKNAPLPLRQLGDQEVDIISMARPVTKYAVELQDPFRVREVVAKAVYIAKGGRPGPVWIDVPMDIQSAQVDGNTLQTWKPEIPGALATLRGDPDIAPNTRSDFYLSAGDSLDATVKTIVEHLKAAKRPVLLGGTGVSLSGRRKDFLNLAELLQIPAVGGWNAYDLVPDAHPCYAGRPGTVGDRPGNFTVQNADFLLILGCRLNIRQVGYNWKSFAANAWKAQVDADLAELHKPTLRNDLAVHADLRTFLPALLLALRGWQALPEHAHWLGWCRERVKRYPVLLPRHRKPGKVNPYAFMERLFSMLDAGDVIVTGNGSAVVVSNQAGVKKEGLRFYSNSGDASMGYDLPAAIGAALTGHAKRVICLAGDGSCMMNIQELETIVGNNLPIVIFLLNNSGYLSIRLTQNAYFADNKFGTGPENGVTFPDFVRIADAFGFSTSRIAEQKTLEASLERVLGVQMPHLCEVVLDPEQGFEPKLASRTLPDGTMVSPSLEDMFPFLDREEFEENIIK
jgi:acetolactate synthase-1/2/3 large subunit